MCFLKESQSKEGNNFETEDRCDKERSQKSDGRTGKPDRCDADRSDQ